MTRKKLELSAPVVGPADPKAIVTAILKVREPNYVPPGVHLRSRIDGMMFTASFTAERLAALEADPLVVSISPSTRLGLIE